MAYKWRKPPIKGVSLRHPALWAHASSGGTKAYEREITILMADGQAGFEYTAQVLVTFDKFLSTDRLGGYYAIAKGDKWVAIQLYELNVELSEALYGVVQGLEVTLRNAIHNL